MRVRKWANTLNKILLLLLLLLSGCTNQKPKLFLGDNTCLLPCWYGIRPGESTLEESLIVLRTLPLVDQGSLKAETYRETGYVHWYFSGNLFGQGRLYFDKNGLLKNIILETKDLDLGVLVDTFGQPEKVWPHYTSGPGGGIEYGLSLFYPEKGVVVGVSGVPSDNPRNRTTEAITRNLAVSGLEFYTPADIETYLKEIKILPETQERIEYIFRYLQSWPGFGQDVVRIAPP